MTLPTVAEYFRQSAGLLALEDVVAACAGFCSTATGTASALTSTVVFTGVPAMSLVGAVTAGSAVAAADGVCGMTMTGAGAVVAAEFV